MTNKYTRKVTGRIVSYEAGSTHGTVEIDIYDVLKAWEVTSQPIGHAIKKLLQPGQRGNKTKLQDIKEAGESITRAIQLEGPDHMNAPADCDFPPISHEDEGWILWDGGGFSYKDNGKLPTGLTGETNVCVMWSDGNTDDVDAADAFGWWHDTGRNIIAYRIIK